ncbi:hypothetical protein GEMRC1_005159 [Eukaryota sp. GEM-RC1]
MSSSSPMKSSRSCNDTVSVGHVIGYKKIPSSTTSSSNSSSDVSYASCSSALSPSTHLRFQQSLLTLIHLRFLSRLLAPSLEWNHIRHPSVLISLKNDIFL